MRTLLLAETPFRDLPSAAMLLEAAEAVPHDPPLLLATRARRAPHGFVPVMAEELPEGIEQVVLAGAFLDRGLLKAALATAAAAVAGGARLVVHNLALEGWAARHGAPEGAGVLDQAERIAVRDHRTANVLTLWRIAAPLRILAYPERHVAADPVLTRTLPPGPILGLAIRGGAEMRRSWQPRLPAIAEALSAARSWPVLPLPMRLPGGPDDDLPAIRALVEAVLPGAALLLPELAEPRFWRARLTPARCKALVARCALVATNRDLPAAYAVAAGVPVLGLALGADRRIVSCIATLANELPPGSALLHPAADPPQPAPGSFASSSARA
ncbi:hypothetical protein [Falsiroseomonas oryzae]|uniref:hypothetical protein n=1 Tax=Falsiroseomonas oryzae TaxID=2766473 RepID=UPI0022EA3316|nr:hypothetical protein [Roseomonas sp. MO-31]